MAGPLKVLKILDFTTLLPGPYATMMLANMGAQVLRVVSGSRPDLAAFIPPLHRRNEPLLRDSHPRPVSLHGLRSCTTTPLL
ncbi:MAG: CoA transferase [Syntrophales bacterium]